MKRIRSFLINRWFNRIYRNNLIYNQCIEDPRLDKIALELEPTDTMLVLTSAGCNILDYLLSGVAKIHAVDMNWRQNALLELKMVMIKQLNYDTFFSFFGKGRIDNPWEIYKKSVQPYLSMQARQFWDKNISMFDAKKNNSFYSHSGSGWYSSIFSFIFKRVLKFDKEMNALVNAPSIEEQAEIYSRFKPFLFSKFLSFFWASDVFLTLLGVPSPQLDLVKQQYTNAVVGYLHDCLQYVMTQTDLKNDNYFWRLYLTGEYTHECCPNYLKETEFLKLKEMDLFAKIQIHSKSIQDFLSVNKDKINKFVLLDHLDWISSPEQLPILNKEWELIFANAAPNARVIWRSVGLNVNWMNDVTIVRNSAPARLWDCLKVHDKMAHDLHQVDRYHSYGCFYIADLLSEPNVVA